MGFVRLPSFLLAVLAAFVLQPLHAQDALAVAARGVREIVAHRGSSADRPENTAAAFLHAIDSGASAIEVDLRLTVDGQLVCLHDETLDRTTNGKGPIYSITLAEARKLDAGSWFGESFRGEQIPAFREILELANGRADVFLDLKGGDERYDHEVVKEVRRFGDPPRTILGVRTLEAARFYRQYLPESRQAGLIATPNDIELFLGEGVKIIRLLPEWLEKKGDSASSGDRLIERVRSGGGEILISAGKGTPAETEPVLRAKPELLFTDHPAALVETLKQLGK